ncbi:MAG: GbsR/MarR family transcriptional regulator [Limisphaerales bacterium]
MGQIYGLLFLAPRALSLDEITSILQISKASVSTGTRQLAGWGAIRQVWVPGDRRDYFDAVTDVASVMRQLFKDFIRPRVVASGDRFEEMVGQLDSELRHGVLTPEEHGHLAARIGALSRIQQKVKTVAPLIERLV